MSQEASIPEGAGEGATDPLGFGTFMDDILGPSAEATPAKEPTPTPSVQPEPTPIVATPEVAPKIDPTPPLPQSVTPTPDAQPVTPTPPAQLEVPQTPEQEVEAMRLQLSEAMGAIGAMATQLQALQSGAGQPKLELPPEQEKMAELDWLQGANPADFLESPEAFNALLNRVATTAARAGQQAGYEMAMRTIPNVVHSAAQQQSQLQAVADNFYKTHPDLVPFKKAVSLAALDFKSKNPAATPEQVLAGAAESTRKVLRMRGTTAGRVPAQPAATPGAVGGTQRTATPAQLTPMEQQILDMMSAVL